MSRSKWGVPAAAVLLLVSVGIGLLFAREQTREEGIAARFAVSDGPGVPADCDGRLHEILLQYVPDLAAELEPTYDDLFSALPTDVRVQVVCPNDRTASAFDARWGMAERVKGRSVEVINVDRPITAWARDRRITRVVGAVELPAAAIVPRRSAEYDEEYRNDLFVSYLFEQRGLWPLGEDTFVHLEGGNVVANGRHVFVGANVIEENEALGSDASTVERELLRILGRAYVLVGDPDQQTPWCHIDMYLTPVDDQTVLVASTGVANMLLASETGVLDDIVTTGNDADSPDYASGQSWQFDAVAGQLSEYGYHVIRLPAVADPNEDWMVTYNNVLMEQRDGQRIVYMPVYDLPVLDRVAEAVYRGLGFDVRTIDVSKIFRHGGAVRCLVNVLSREPARLATALSPTAAPDGLAAADLVLPSQPEPPPPSPELHVSSNRSPQWFPVPGVWLPLFVFCARILDVSIGTVKLICITRGRKGLAISLALAEVTIWLLAVASVVTHLNNLLNVLAYVGGFTVGTALGMWIEQHLALGVETVMLISQQKGKQIAEALREAHLHPTTFTGTGRDGPVVMCLAFVPRRLTSLVLGLSRAIDRDVIVTVEDVRHTSIKWAGGGGTGRILPTNGRRRFPWAWRPAPPPEPQITADEAA
jgi:uncharacterized protein YebE (UPF0316 family)